MSSILEIQFPEDFEERYRKYVARFKTVRTEVEEPEKKDAGGVRAIVGIGREKTVPVLTQEMEIGGLAAYSDGSIRYKGTIIGLRPQLKELCRLFMQQPKKLLNHDDIKDKIVDAPKRANTSDATIAKYVSELSRALKIHFKKEVIFNSNQDGWYFDTAKK